MDVHKEKFGFEIDFLPVGEGLRSGDAICMRWGDLYDSSRQIVMLVDGGFARNAEEICNHVRTYYKTTHLNYVVITHPHADHTNGIKAILEDKDSGLTIGSLLMHDPRNHIKIAEFDSETLKASTVRKKLNEELSTVKVILQIAKDRGISHYEPFSGWKEWDAGYGVKIQILNPTKEFYEKLLASFASTPTQGSRTGSGRLEYTGGVIDAGKATLTDVGETSAENDASVVMCVKLPAGEIILLTGDAGLDALEQSIKKAKKCGIDIPMNIRVFKVPHHGSIQNLGEDVLDGILGDGTISTKRKNAYAMIMVSKKPAKGHPDKTVTNSIWDRNCVPYKTGGHTLCYAIGDCPDRGWSAAEAIQYYKKVDNVS